MSQIAVPFLIGFGVILLLWVGYAVIAGNWNPFKIIEGADGRPSTSKLQFFLWTVVGLFSYAALYAARVIDAHAAAALSKIPPNLMIAMGLSITTATAAKTITASFVESGKIIKHPVAAGAGLRLASLLRDDSDVPDLSKMQLLGWTAISIFVYLIAVAYTIRHVTLHNPGDLPDIDAALMVLMGLGQGAYIGKKLVTTSTPRLTGLSPNTGPAGTTIKIMGLSLGGTKDGNQVTFDGKAVDSSLVSDWSNTMVTFTVPPSNPDGKGWPASGQQVLVGVITNGQDSANRLPLMVK